MKVINTVLAVALLASVTPVFAAENEAATEEWQNGTESEGATFLDTAPPAADNGAALADEEDPGEDPPEEEPPTEEPPAEEPPAEKPPVPTPPATEPPTTSQPTGQTTGGEGQQVVGFRVQSADAAPQQPYATAYVSDEEYTPVKKEKEVVPPAERRFLHGPRLGYNYFFNMTDEDLADYNLRAPHSFLFGYELSQRLKGHGPVNFIFSENVLIGGLEQSRFFPTFNFLCGFEFGNQLQIAAGVSIVPVRSSWSHMVAAIGWTPLIGSLYVPIHAFFLPDVDGHHRAGVTVGLNW